MAPPRPASPESLPPVAATRSRGRPYEGWTLKELIGEVRRLRRAASSAPPRPAGVLDLDGAPNQGDARASDTVALSPPSPCESQEQPHHLGKRLEDVLISLRDVAFQFIKIGRQDEVPKIVNVAHDIVVNFCNAISAPEAFKLVAAAENVKPHLLKIDHDDNLLFLQFKAALEREQQVHNVNHEIAISLDKYTNCPLSGTEIAELTQPLRSMTCGHIFERQHIMNYMGSSLKGCPVIG
ncbi:uncharacterized protein LOC127778832 [Oryza glaberrima]|uniref:uncharacterized protein LOC127778832 n=1 Tax=Oryza glaberrima TaxID=4538 RepID=UPI00224BFB8E|nr:uncharacterized protein LOC127778832 [Oryza glaberrima]